MNKSISQLENSRRLQKRTEVHNICLNLKLKLNFKKQIRDITLNKTVTLLDSF